MAMGADKSGAQFTMKDDPRITPIGRWLRRLRIDEWPQFWNVIKGDMSLIGPRPEQVDLAGEFAVDIPYYNLRYRVKPGITGWAQIKQGYVADREPTKKKLEYDLYYIKHIGVFLDSWILFNTLRVVLFGSGAR